MIWQKMKKVAAALILTSLPLGVGCGARHVASTKDASELVAALHDPSNEARAAAAASLRRLLAADPGVRTNDHGRDYWQKQVAKVKPGMRHAQVVKLLPPYDKTLSEERLLWSGPGSGQSHSGMWRLDHYWMVWIWYRNPECLGKWWGHAGRVNGGPWGVHRRKSVGWPRDFRTCLFGSGGQEMLIQPRFLKLSDLLANRLFRIPEYQRSYSWGRKQRQDMFEDIRNVGKGTDRNHFMATIVGLQRGKKTIVTDEHAVVEIVDGQQRLTTLIVLLKAIVQKLDKQMTAHAKLAQELQELLVKQDDISLILLQMNHDSSHHFADYLRHGQHPNKEDVTTLAGRALAAAIDECEEFVAGYGDIIELVSVLKNRLTFVFHQIEDEAAVYTVFEVLNSRGLPVPWLDRLKSMLMGLAFEHDQGNLAEVVKELHGIWQRIYSTIGLRQGLGTEALRFAATLWTKPRRSKTMGEEDAVTELVRVVASTRQRPSRFPSGC